MMAVGLAKTTALIKNVEHESQTRSSAPASRCWASAWGRK